MRYFLGWAWIAIGCDSPKTVDTGAGAGQEVDPLSWSVEAPGPFQTGYRSWEVSYSPGEGFPERTIRLNLWYPTDVESGPTSLYTIGIDEAAFDSVDPATSVYPEGFPVHVYSHGFRGYGAASAFMARHFASHGWVTVAPDHINNTIVDHNDPLPSAHYFHRPLDVRAVLDALASLPEDDPLSDQINVSSVMLSGHSFGAYTTWATVGASYDIENVAEMCATGEGIHDDGCTAEEEAMFATDLSDPRVVSTFPMAGSFRRTWFGDSGEMSVAGPVMFLGGTNDDVGQQEQFESMGEIDFTWVEIEGGCHQTFALGACPSLETDLGFHITQTYALSFARVTVLGDSSAQTSGIVSGDVSISDLVTTKSVLGG